MNTFYVVSTHRSTDGRVFKTTHFAQSEVEAFLDALRYNKEIGALLVAMESVGGTK